ncbi:hypothetical protein [Chamaesiphon sp.]|uniref:hypothetical protein n=1 Tax=Chamaesiphon sp. TaxID=2814140 RepID=UPI003594774C
MSSPIHHLGGKWPYFQTLSLDVGGLRIAYLKSWLQDRSSDRIELSVPNDRVSQLQVSHS